MPDWTVCPRCALKHSRRPDGVCPRCKGMVDEAPPPPSSDAPPDVYDGSVPPRLFETTAAFAAPEAPIGARVAGAVMILNGCALATERAMGIPGNKGGAFLFAFILGGLVLAGKMGAIKTARWLVLLVGLGLPVLYLTKGQGLAAGIQIVYTTSLLVLLVGNASRLRMGIGLLGAALYFVVEGAGFYGIVTGHYPLARVLIAHELDAGPAGVVDGQSVRYRLRMPNDRWYRRTEAVARKENPLADRWLVRPDRDAHVLVIAETLPESSTVEMDRFAEVVIKNLTANAKSFTVVSQSPLETTLEAGRVVRASSISEGKEMEWCIGLFVQHPYIFQVLAFSTRRNFALVEPDLRAVIESFELP